MSKSHDVFLYVGTYDSEVDAEFDLMTVKDLHSKGVIGTYDAAVVSKLGDEVQVHKIEKPTQRGAWTGVGVGAVVGILFPPSLIGSALVGGAAGGLIGHFSRGMARKDVKELGETLDNGQAALIVIGRDKLGEQIDAVMSHARDRVERELDMEGTQLDQELVDAAGSSKR
jgi:uncharacterized membrane protein